MFSALWLNGRKVSVVRIQLQKNTEFRTLMRNKSPALDACGETIFVINNLHLDCGSRLPQSKQKVEFGGPSQHFPMKRIFDRTQPVTSYT